MAAKKLRKEQRQELARTFVDLDENGDGVLSREEVGTWIKSEGYNLTNQEIERVFRQMDEDEDGRITLDEFLNFNAWLLFESGSPTPTTRPSKAREGAIKQLEEIFRELDENRDGLLPREQVERAVADSGYGTEVKNLHKLLTSLDLGNGEVNYASFLQSYKPPLTRDDSRKKLLKNN